MATRMLNRVTFQSLQRRNMSSDKFSIILGTMDFGRQLDDTQSHEIMKSFLDMGYCELDTALVYGRSEDVIGKFPKWSSVHSEVKVATKANPKYGFSCNQIVEQMNRSLEQMQIPSVDLYYLHKPDHVIPIEDTLEGINRLHNDGKFKEFGLSNYAAWQVVEIYHICKQKGYVLPTVYQGMYNALTRSVEDELFPALRKYGLRFYAYNPLAGGILARKYSYSDSENSQPRGRFFGISEESSKSYQARYWKKEYFECIEELSNRLIQYTHEDAISMSEASLRWLRHHSQLSAERGDGIIVGVSKLPHLQANIKAIEKGPLDAGIVEAFNQAWYNIRSNVPCYYR